MQEIWFTSELMSELKTFSDTVRSQEGDQNLVIAIARSWKEDNSISANFAGITSIEKVGVGCWLFVDGQKLFLADSIARDAPTGACVFSLGHRDSLQVLVSELEEYRAPIGGASGNLVQGLKC
jgi:hypothetical protein